MNIRFTLLLAALLSSPGWTQPSEKEEWEFSGEWRQQSVFQTNLDFGVAEPDSMRQLLSRLRLKLDYRHAPGWELRLGVSNSLALSSVPPSPNDQDLLYLEEGYVKWADSNSEVTLGRQLLSLGSERLVSKRLGPNVPLSFDGVHYQYSAQDWKLRLLAVSPVRNNNRALADNSGGNFLWGAYATRPWNEQHSADFYLLGSRRDGLRLAGSAGQESRYSLGTRLFGGEGAWDYNCELVYQWGQLENRPISAWTVATDNGWTVSKEGWQPRLGLKFDVASGSAGGRRLGTFHPLYPNFSYFSEAALISPSNLIDLNPNISLKPADNQKLVLGWDFLWRQSLNDGLYVPPGVELLGARAGTGARIGDQISLLYQNKVAENVEFELGFTHFRPGQFVREAGGSATTFVVTSWKVDF